MTFDVTPQPPGDTYITLIAAKEHLRIEPDETDDHDVIIRLLHTCEEYVEGYLGADWETTAPSEGEKTAVLLLVGHYYENREATTPIKIEVLPLGLKNLLTNLGGIDAP